MESTIPLLSDGPNRYYSYYLCVLSAAEVIKASLKSGRDGIFLIEDDYILALFKRELNVVVSED